ncbi:hypothetical protein A8M60_06830 [Nocardia farcinica]|nr:hypothetical protein A8M60_06830 [Nocardia farcinica]
MEEQRNWAEVLAGPLAGASIGAIVVIGLALAGPGRYYGWRLQKVLDLLGGMEGLENMGAQRRELRAESERLGKRVAAIHRIPTEWDMLLVGVLGYAWTYGFALGLARWHSGQQGWPAWADVAYWVGYFAVLVPGMLTAFWGVQSARYTKQERFRFTRAGMPADFHRQYSPRPKFMTPQPSEWDAPLKRSPRRGPRRPGGSP